MTVFVVDASVVAKWFFPETHSDKSRRLLAPRHKLMAPELMWSEFGNITWKRVRRDELTADEAAEIINDFIRLPLDVVPAQNLLGAALELAIETDSTVYDCLYLAAAIDRKCRFVTADERFANSLASTPFAKHVRHLARLR